MDTSVWWIFLAVTFLIGIFSQIYLLAAFSVMLAVVGLLAQYWQMRVLKNIRYIRRPFYWRGFPEEQVSVQFEVENRKFLPVTWLRIDDPWPLALAPEQDGLITRTENPGYGIITNLFSLRWYERSRQTISIRLKQRGIYMLGPARLEAGDLFGIFSSVTEQSTVDFLTVFPEQMDFETLRLPANDPFGDRRARRRIFEDPIYPVGVRNYHPEDGFRRVHWPATAHTGELKSRIFQPVSAQVMMVCLNISTFPRYWEGTYPELLEHLVRVASAVIQRALQDGYRVGLISNGCLAHADQPFRLPPGRSPQQLARLLEALAGVTPFATASFEDFLTYEMRQLPFGSTVVVVTGLWSPQLLEILSSLKRHGHSVSLLLFSTQPTPRLNGVHILHQPFNG